MSKRWSVLILSAGLAMAGAAPALGAVDLVMRVSPSPAAGDFVGESARVGAEGAIDISSFDWGAARPASPTPGGGNAGRVQFTSFRFAKPVDRTSPAFVRALAGGITLPSVRLTLAVPLDGRSVTFLEYCAERVSVAGYQVAGSAAGDRPIELIELAFRRFSFRYVPMSASGVPQPEVSGGWDSDANAEAPFNPACGR